MYKRQALERVGKREPGPLGGLFEAAAEGIYMQEGESLQKIWRRQEMCIRDRFLTTTCIWL